MMINVVVASSPKCYFVGKHPFVILCSYFLAGPGKQRPRGCCVQN